MAKHMTITIRAPVELIQGIERLAREEQERTGLPVDRSGIIRRALERDLAARQAQAITTTDKEKSCN